MRKGRKMYESYWAFKTGKWTKIDCINGQVVPKIYDTFSKEVRPNRIIAKVFKNLIRVASIVEQDRNVKSHLGRHGQARIVTVSNYFLGSFDEWRQNGAVPALESWRLPPGASERPLRRGPREAPKQAPLPPPLRGLKTVHFHTVCTMHTYRGLRVSTTCRNEKFKY